MSAGLMAPASLGRLLGLTLRAPGEAARFLLALDLPRAVLWQALALVTVLSVLIVALAPGPMPPALPTGEGEVAVLTPLAYAGLLGTLLVLLGVALHVTGTALGGSGSFAAALVLVIWIEVVATAVRVAQILAFLMSPALGAVVAVAGVVVLLRTLVSFVDVLHGFGHRGKAALVLLLAVTGMSLGLAVVMSLFGLAPGAGGGDV